MRTASDLPEPMQGADRRRVTALLSTGYGAQSVGLFPLYESDDAAIYRVSIQGTDRWVLRRFPRSRPLERVDGDARILTFLDRARFPAERLISTLDGRTSCHLDGHGVMVTALIPGNPPGSTAPDLRSLGSLLGRLLSLDRPPPEVRRKAGSLPREDLAYGRRCLAEVEGLLEDAWRPRWEALGRALDATSDCVDLPQTLIHPDCHPGNALRRPDGRIELIDWTGAGIGPRIAALGVLLSGAVLTSLDRNAGECDLARVDAVMEGFHQHANLEPEEIARMADAIRFRPLVLAAREFAASVRAGSAPDGRRDRHDLAEVVADRVAHTVNVL